MQKKNLKAIEKIINKQLGSQALSERVFINFIPRPFAFSGQKVCKMASRGGKVLGIVYQSCALFFDVSKVRIL